RIFALKELDQLLAHVATQIPQRRSVVGADQGAQLDGGFLAIADLKACDLAVPQLGLPDNLRKLLADNFNRGGVIDIKENAANQLAAGPGPVLERLFDEIAERHDHTPQIPQLDHHIAERDLFDGAGLVLDDDGVIDADRLRDRKLHAGKEVAQHRPCCQSGDNAGNARGGKQRNAVLPNGVESQQRKSDGHQHDHHLEHPLQHANLGDVLACQQVVRNVEPKAPEIEI